MTNRETPETIMTGTTADISHICEFGGYDWVMFCDNTPTYPDDTLTLGQYLGPATDIGLALTAKIPKHNGQYVCCFSLQHLMDNKIHCHTHSWIRTDFDESILMRP